MPKNLITAEEARQFLDYNPETGVFTWRVGRSGTARVGSIAGRVDSGGYIQIAIYGRRYQAHRLAWLIIHGVWPEKHIDHINGKPRDNRLCNLRLATQSENLCNTKRRSDNTSGLKGVSWHNASKKWRARIAIYRQTKVLGYFATPEEAHAAYCNAARELHGEFANFG